MSTVEKTINSKVKSDIFFRENLVKILERTNQAVSSIERRAKERSLPIDENMRKELYAKSMLETVNRLIFQEVYQELKSNDQTYSKQPGLVAHPSTVIQMPDCNL